MVFLKQFEEIEKKLKILDNPDEEELRTLSRNKAIATGYGSLVYPTRIKGRSASKTEIIKGDQKEGYQRLIEKISDYLNGKQMICLDREIGDEKSFSCRAYVSREYANIPYLWGRMLFRPNECKNPDFRTIQVPEWPETKVLVDPEEGVSFILGSDYTGELKKANLRLAMYQTKKAGGLGLHAGSKLMKVREGDGNLKEKGILLFGLSATGKTTLTCHHHWLDEENGEGVIIRQDDVVLMQKDSSCLGTERNFYIKTDGLEPVNQPLLYKAATREDTLFENVVVNEDGLIDFFDTSITTNGRAVISRNKMRYTDSSIDLEKADIIIFITRSNGIVPPVAKLDELSGAAFFMLGESMGSAASDVDPGKPRRVVGTNPFIIGSRGKEGNRFHELLRVNPHLECYLLNTGSIGEGGRNPEKITVHDSAVILREIARGGVEWRKDSYWNYLVLEDCPGVDISKFQPERHYNEDEYLKKTRLLEKDRHEWLNAFEELSPRIKQALWR